MTTTTKAKTYTTELVATITEKYLAGTTLEELAKETGKTVPSLRSKLVAEKVYVAKKAVTKTGSTPVRKIALARKVAELTGIESLDTLEKASKAELELLVAFLSE